MKFFISRNDERMEISKGSYVNFLLPWGISEQDKKRNTIIFFSHIASLKKPHMRLHISFLR